MPDVAPFLIFMIGAALAAVTSGHLRAVILIATPIVGGINLLFLDFSAFGTIGLLGFEMVPVAGDRLSMLFGWLFHLAALIGVIYGLHVADRLQHTAALAYAGCAVGAVFAGDFITLFLFWEGLALTSTALVVARRTNRSLDTAIRYLVIQVSSGLLMLAGIVFLADGGQALTLGPMALEGWAAWLIFIAVGVKCGFPLLHSWITDTYPEATETGTVLMSAFTTKVAVYALARVFPGTEELIVIGAVMTMFPIFYAVIENDLRRVLAYSMINQLGFMVVGIGIGTELAINGAVSHVFNHVIYKSLLFMTMGAVLFRTGKIGGSELGGLYRTMPATTGFCIIGAASISAFPLLSGFVSKSLIMAAALEEGHHWIWLALLFASAGVFHHAGIKVPFFAFFAHDSGLRPREAPRPMIIAMAIAAFVCIFNGLFPQFLYSMLPYPVDYVPYTTAHVLTQCQLLFFSALAFILLKIYGLYPPELPGVNIDADWSYRWLLPRLVRRCRDGMTSLGEPLFQIWRYVQHRAMERTLHWSGPTGRFARDPVMTSASIAIMSLFAVVLIVLLLLGR